MPSYYEYYDKEGKRDPDEPDASDFLRRMRAVQIDDTDLNLARERFGVELPDDVVEQIARQQAVARPVLEQYHLLHEQTPSIAIARASMEKDIDAITDIVAAMDLTDLDDVGEFADEYTCPRCAHRWSGAPNYRTGYGDKVYVPTGRVSRRTGRPLSDRYGPPIKSNKEFKYGRNWRGSSAAKLPRGFGNRDIGVPIVGENWRGRRTQKK
jgi:hypothetical protein